MIVDGGRIMLGESGGEGIVRRACIISLLKVSGEKIEVS
jgi:hypothetical protein